MNLPAFSFPEPMGKLLSWLPTLPPSFVLTQALNLVLKGMTGSLEPLRGKRIAIHVRDVGLHFHFTVDADKFSPIASGGIPNLAISASARDFLLLAARREDPDTLFFSRRLIVEGDTELGLVAKNTLDAIELPKFDVASLSPRNVMA